LRGEGEVTHSYPVVREGGGAEPPPFFAYRSGLLRLEGGRREPARRGVRVGHAAVAADVLLDVAALQLPRERGAVVAQHARDVFPRLRIRRGTPGRRARPR